jgi:glycosyltransferase involved in cell wall biosynthesis
MTVVYYTSTYFLDISLDIINVLKRHVDLHVFIEVTSSSRNMTVVDIDAFPPGKMLATPAELLNQKDLENLTPYFAGTASTHFVLHEHKTGFSYSTIQASLAVWKYVKPFKPQIIHFEGYTLRTIGMLPFLFSVKKVFMAIHDPVPHTGEKSWKIGLPNLLFFNLPFKKRFIFYSEFARNLFVTHYKHVKAPKLLVKLCAYSYYKRQPNAEVETNRHILFFGRISPYKGVDVLMEAMPSVFDEFPNQVLVIAGKSTNGYQLENNIPQKYKGNVQIINRYIPEEELLTLISNAKFVVCPYLDATQSGVLMTSFALNTPVIASEVGSFPEFITNGFNGLLVTPANAGLLSKSIAAALRNDFYLDLKNNVTANNANHTWEQSLEAVTNEYLQI